MTYLTLSIVSAKNAFDMKKILVPIDFSENAEKALTAARMVADETNARLFIFHAFQPYVPDMTIPVGTGTIPLGDELETAMRNQLDSFVSRLQAEGYEAEGLWETGGIHSTVIRKAKELEADLIVIGRTGKGGFLDKLIGSAATGIALDAPCPVLVIPPQAVLKSFREVVYATQLEYEENDILRKVFGLSRTLGSRLSLVKINALEQPDIQDDDQYIEQINAEFELDEKEIVIRSAGSVRGGIEDYCEEIHADLLIVSARHRGFLEEFIINPSVTKKLVITTRIPLLVYHLNV